MNNIPFENYKNRLSKAIALFEEKLPQMKQRYIQLSGQIKIVSTEYEKAKENVQKAQTSGRSTRNLEVLAKSRYSLLNQLQKSQESTKNRLLQFTILKNKLKQTQENLMKVQEGTIKLSNENVVKFKNTLKKLFKEAKANNTNEAVNKNTVPLMNTTRSKRLGWCNSIGRCFEGFTARLTRKNKTKNNKKEGGKRRQTRKGK
jgi:hypothetical protein